MILHCLSELGVGEPRIEGCMVRAPVTLRRPDDQRPLRFELQWRYERALWTEAEAEIWPLMRLTATLPLLNYTLFAPRLDLAFPVAQADLELIEKLNQVFAADILVNKLARPRADYVLPAYRPAPADLEALWAARAEVRPELVETDRPLMEAGRFEEDACGILSSGGKESLLTYGLLRELGARVHPLYINESGGHWRTALTAYRHHRELEPRTGRVWTNLDRFFVWMLDRLPIIRPDHRRVKADTYPLRLCIFPIYVFMVLPLVVGQRLGNVLIGSEFDDPRAQFTYHGIPHHFGVYDQTLEFDRVVEAWASQRLPGLRQWSAVRPISGLVVERVLATRYPELAASQRSCHSCRLQGAGILPCGSCSKCLGVLLFLLANRFDPTRLGYTPEAVETLPGRLARGGLRLDADEREHAESLARLPSPTPRGSPHPHVEGLHVHPWCDLAAVPETFRSGLVDLITPHTTGWWELDPSGVNWVSCHTPLRPSR